MKIIIRHKLISFFFYLFRIFPIDNQKIVYSNFSGKGYGGNPKYIYEEAVSRHPDWKSVWIISSDKYREGMPKEIRTVKKRSIRMFYELATAKVWVDNCRKPLYVKKRKGQFYIMTWHGMLPMKKVEKDALEYLPAHYKKYAVSDSRMTDLYLSGSEFDTKLYRNSFWYEGRILTCGIPRDDMFFRSSNEEKYQEVRKALNIAESWKILLYAPTFRDNSCDLDIYALNWTNLLHALNRRFGGRWVGLIRLHPCLASEAGRLHLPPNIMDVTDYPDIQELLLVSDCVLTDYSSVMFEFGLQNKPVFLMIKDYKDHHHRGYYLPLETLPFPFSTDENTLCENIIEFHEELYKNNLRTFYHDVCGLYQGGESAKEAVNIIEEQWKGQPDRCKSGKGKV